MGYALTVLWRDGTRETVSDHATLKVAAQEAFELAERLSRPGATRAATEVAVIRGSRLQLSIAILPGEGFGRPGA